MNSYLNNLKESIPSELTRLLKKEIQNICVFPQTDYPNEIFKDYFDFYLETLGIGINEFYSYFTERNKEDLSDFLFSPIMVVIKDREKIIEKFIPILEQDFSFFKKCFSVCLTEEKSYKYVDLQKENELKEREYNVLKILINLGIKKQYFSFLEKDFFYTKNQEYKRILMDYKIIDNNFSVNDLYDEVKRRKELTIRRRNNLFFMNYSKEIVNLYRTYPSFFDNLSTDEVNGFVYDFFDMIENTTTIDLKDKEQSVLNLITKRNVRKEILRNNIGYDFIISHSNLFSEWMCSFDEDDKKDFFSIRNYNRKEITFFENWIYKKNYKGQKLEKTFYLNNDVLDFICQNLKNNNPERLNEVKKITGNFLRCYIKENLTIDINDNKNIGNFSLLIKKYEQELVNSIDVTVFNNVYIKMVQDLETIFKMGLTTSDEDKRMVQRIKGNIKENLQKILKEIINGGVQKDTDTMNSKNLNDIWNNHQALGNIWYNVVWHMGEDNTILDFLKEGEFNWKDYKTDIYKKNSRYSTMLHDLPFLFIVLYLSKGKCIDWFIENEERIAIYTTKYKNKDIVSYFYEKDWFPDFLKRLTKDEVIFKKMILKNQGHRRMVEKLEESHSDDENYRGIKSLIEYMKLKYDLDKVKNGEETSLRKRIKL